MTRPLTIVAAVAENGVIGRDNKLIWRLRSDLRRFRDLTWGKPMIMGRKTFDSIGKALSGRRTVVVTRDRGFAADGVDAAHGWPEALARAEELADELGAAEIAVVGGAEIYRQALPQARRLHLTLVHASPEGDAVFPDFDREDVVALRERIRHHLGGLVDVHLQRVDAVIRLVRNLAQPVRQFVEVELLAGAPRIVEFALSDDLERMHVHLLGGSRRDQNVFGVALRDDLRAHQIVEHATQVQKAFWGDSFLER